MNNAKVYSFKCLIISRDSGFAGLRGFCLLAYQIQKNSFGNYFTAILGWGTKGWK